jgi:hypothetical protein
MMNTVWTVWMKIAPGDAPFLGPCGNIDNVYEEEWDNIPTPMEIVVILREATKKDEEPSKKGSRK